MEKESIIRRMGVMEIDREIKRLQGCMDRYKKTGNLPPGMSYKDLSILIQTYRNKQIRNSKKRKNNE